MYRKMLDGILIGEFVKGAKLELDEKMVPGRLQHLRKRGTNFCRKKGDTPLLVQIVVRKALRV